MAEREASGSTARQAPVGAEKRLHKATYARDKRKGGYLVRVAGPYPEQFAGRTVPVVRMDGTESLEKLNALIWTGVDEEHGGRVALYTFEARPREAERDELPF